jgi:hypothetical protein
MKVLAIGSIIKPLSDDQKTEIMSREVPATLRHYLSGKIEQFWTRLDAPGVVFLFDVASVEEAKTELDALPLVTTGFARYDLIPLGPLAPLGLLIQGK